jgi:hypothetical protein
VLPSRQKLILGLLATITFQIGPVPSASALLFIKCILEIVASEDVHHHLNCVERQLSSLISIWETEKSRAGGGRQLLFGARNVLTKMKV